MNLTGQRILLTGGTSGVGLALLRALHRRGNRLVVVGRNPARIAALQAEFPDVRFLASNLASPADVAALAKTLNSDAADVAVLINNAGVQYNYVLGDTPDGYARIAAEVQTNLTAAVQLCDALLPTLRAQPAAAIVNVTSGLGISPKQSAPVYCATKAGLQVFTKALRYQLEGTPVQVVDIVLPLVDTPMTEGRAVRRSGPRKISPEQVADELIQGVEAGRTTINVGKVKLFRLIHRLAPALADRLLKTG